MKIVDIQPVGVGPGPFSNKYFFTIKFTLEKPDGKRVVKKKRIPKGYKLAKVCQNKMHEFVSQARSQLIGE